MGYTAPAQGTAGSVVTATIYNRDMIDNIAFLGVTHDHSGDTGDGGNLKRSSWTQPHYAEGSAVLSAERNRFGVSELLDTGIGALKWAISIPSNLEAIDKLAVVLDPEASGNINRRVGVHYGGVGESGTTHGTLTGTAAFTTVDDQIIEDSIAGHVGDIAAGDYLGVYYERYGATGGDTYSGTLNVLGLVMEWH